MDDVRKMADMTTSCVVLKVFDRRRKSISVHDINSWREECVRVASLYYYHPRQEQYIREHEQRVRDTIASLEQGEVPEWLEKAAAFIQRELEEGKGPISRLLAHT
ncbi:hypothetical protein KTR10_02510 [Candidatus Kaiserbacteria bacterium]|nr:hypothetical protein [Candidatus Kaiserbacteria bacterium]